MWPTNRRIACILPESVNFSGYCYIVLAFGLVIFTIQYRQSYVFRTENDIIKIHFQGYDNNESCLYMGVDFSIVRTGNIWKCSILMQLNWYGWPGAHFILYSYIVSYSLLNKFEFRCTQFVDVVVSTIMPIILCVAAAGRPILANI